MQTLAKYTWLFILMLSMTAGLGAQTQEQFIEAAEEYYQFGDFANAAYLYGEALEFDSTDQNLRLLKGESNLYYRAYERALKDFATMERDGAAASFPRLPYLQGKASQPLGRYDAAITFFSRFLANPGNAPIDEIEDAELQLNNTKWAKDLVAAYQETVTAGTQDNAFPINYANVNTRYDDFSPFFESDQFYFSSLRFRVDKDSIKPTRKIARIIQRNAEGNDALNRPLPDNINQRNRTAAHSAFNEAGNMVYFTYCEYLTDSLSLRCDLYSATVSPDGEWGTPQKLDINAAGANNTQPNVGMHPDGQEYLYFSSDRAGGEGMHDLYRAPIGADGALGTVAPLSDINTPFDDVTPFYYAPQRELYFSTDGRHTMGGLDIYRASLNGESWMQPIHMGLPTNSSYNDVYYSRFEEHDFAYFASNRHSAEALFWDEDEEVCCNDIYKVEIERICLEVTTWHALTKAELDATTVTFYEEFPNGERVELAQETHANDNLYTFEVEKGRKYSVTGVKRGFKDDQTTIDLSLTIPYTKGGDDCIKAELYLPPPKITLEVVTLNKIDRSELNGCTVDLFSGPNDNSPLQQDASDTKTESNFYAYDIVLERYYEVKGSKPEYTPDSATVDTRGLFVLNDTVIKRELLLEPILPDPCTIEPTVYFHNDKPIKGNPRTTTPVNYIDAYNAYVGTHKPNYYRVWGGAAGQDATERKGRLDEYFGEVDQGAAELEEFASLLKNYLANGGKITVTLQGFASPLSTGPYNDELSARRCISVINYLWNYEGGSLQQYMGDAAILMFNKAHVTLSQKTYRVPTTYKGMPVTPYQSDSPLAPADKSLIFDIKPGGEIEADPANGLVDSGDDSIYSPVAGFTRFVEIKVEGCGEQSPKDTPEIDTREY